jgi:hypothetical protein
MIMIVRWSRFVFFERFHKLFFVFVIGSKTNNILNAMIGYNLGTLSSACNNNPKHPPPPPSSFPFHVGAREAPWLVF